MIARVLLLLLTMSLMVAQTPVSAQSKSSQGSSRKSLEGEKPALEAARKKAADGLVVAFDTAEKRLRDGGGTAETRLTLVKELQAQKTAFVAKGALPEMDEMASGLFGYYQSIHQARTPVLRVYEKLLDQALKSKDEMLAESLRKDMGEIDQSLYPPVHVRVNSSWNGGRRDVRGQPLDLKLSVKEKLPAGFKGRLTQEQGNATLQVIGNLDGNYVQIQVTGVTRGKSQLRSLSGYIVHKKMILEERVPGAKGAVPGLVILNLK